MQCSRIIVVRRFVWSFYVSGQNCCLKELGFLKDCDKKLKNITVLAFFINNMTEPFRCIFCATVHMYSLRKGQHDFQRHHAVLQIFPLSLYV